MPSTKREYDISYKKIVSSIGLCGFKPRNDGKLGEKILTLSKKMWYSTQNVRRHFESVKVKV